MINRALFKNPYRYPTVVLWWDHNGDETELRLVDKTLKEAYNMAVEFGYQPPKWYTPWRYITGGLGVMTVGIGVIDA